MEENLVLISALQHFAYCPRQCALMFVESIWTDNTHTIQGTLVHERVDKSAEEINEDGVTILRALPIFSKQYGLTGKADVVEIHDGQPVPVEYKKSRTRKSPNYDVQLCVQALCLEEMFGKPVEYGFIYNVGSKKRRKVLIDEVLRHKTLDILAKVRLILINQTVPSAIFDKKCQECSLKGICLPEIDTAKSSHSYLWAD